ncbi:MAG: aminomethyl-transferring glycine dehydrogenase subunit GcvPA [Deltaproteobacteria bacterium]|nr:aminomethyl-transferring glycine dehydrogenase subunit GcvPA [Deltaproteobacteria bacterium]
MRYIPATDKDLEAMLADSGAGAFEEIISQVPKEIRDKAKLKLPPELDELSLMRHMKSLSDKNAQMDDTPTFLGAGAYNHFIPAAVGHILSRAEFFTAYTPYQPEISQGTLQAIYEFQTYVTLLTGMDVANASMYDGASALAEAVLMAVRIKRKRQKVFISSAVHPEYRETVKTYTGDLQITIVEIPYTDEGKTDIDWLEKNIDEDTAAVALQYPNFFGTVDDMNAISKIVSAKEALFISATTEIVALGLLKAPAEFGVDIAVAEGQSLGNAVNFGGPHVGLFATKTTYLRNMPGRLVGETEDLDGKRGYVLTLSTREQHIRREKATSNICSNQSLCALAFTIHLSLLGKRGFKELAQTNLELAHYAKEKIASLPGFSIRFNSPTFNEFVIQSDKDVIELNRKLLKRKIIGGLPLQGFYPELKNTLLFCVTEKTGREEIERLAEALGDIS